MLAFNILICFAIKAQVPSANFTVSPNPVCSGATNSVQITDLSTNNPGSWSYTIAGLGPGPGAITSTVQNPSLSFNGPGIYTITLISGNGAGQSSPVSYTILVLPSPNAQLTPQARTTCTNGNPITLTITSGGPAAGSLTYNWSTSASTSSISVTPSVTTIYSCVVTSTNGCSIVRTSTITVAPTTVTITSNPVNICPGTSSTLIATESDPAPFTYSWSTGATTRAVPTSTPGVYTVTVTNGSGCTATQTFSLGTSNTLSLTATALPTVVCAGNTGTLHVTGATSYSWSTGATAANATVSAVPGIIYTVTGAAGTCTGVTTITLNVNSPPTVTISASGASICAGTSVALNAFGATTYTWLPATVSSSLIVSPSVNTTYTVRGNNPGCANVSATTQIVVSPEPTLSASSSSTSICAGEIAALAVSGANTYTWSTGSQSSVMIITPTVTTTYTVTGMSSANCSATTSVVQTVNACTGINTLHLDDTSLVLYPNPCSGSFSIRSAGDMEITLFDAFGKVINRYALNDTTAHQALVSDLAEGIYFVSGKNSTGLVVQKVIVR